MKKISSVVMGFLSLLFIANCRIRVEDPLGENQSTLKSQGKTKVVLLTIDGVRWEEVFFGTDSRLYKKHSLTPEELLPNIYHYFVEKGSSYGRESPVVVSGENHISLPGYLEMMRGYPTMDCVTNLCEPEVKPTLVDNFEKVAVFSSWDTVRKSINGYPNHFVVNSGRNHRSQGFHNMKMKDDQDFDCYVGHFDYRPDEFTMKSTFDYLSKEVPNFLWVSLGDTDEHAHSNNYEGYLFALKRFDFFVGEIIREYDDDTIFIITTDHGRSLDWTQHGYDPQSSRVWLMIHGNGIPHSGHVKLAGARTLSDITPTVLQLTHGIQSNRSFLRTTGESLQYQRASLKNENR